MGNQLLMRWLIILWIGAISAAAVTIDEIDKLVNDIKQERVGLQDKQITGAKDPFIYSKNRKSYGARGKAGGTKKIYYRLNAIFNDEAKINGKWYRLNHRVGHYTLKSIGNDYVVLNRLNRNLRIYLKKAKSKKIKLTVK